jgi:hypothetical protein
MSITKIGPYHDHSGSYIRKIGKYTGPASYATGGDATFTPTAVGLGTLEAVFFTEAVNGNTPTTVYHLVLLPNGNVYWEDDGTGNEATNGADLSAYTAMFEVIGH